MSTPHQINCASYARALTLFRRYTPGMALRIKELRIQAGFTQQELAEKAGLERSQLSKIENEREPANTRRLSAIARALGVEVNDLFSSDKEPDETAAEILDAFRRLSPEQRDAVLAHARALVALGKRKS